jgi:hypothetical protein
MSLYPRRTQHEVDTVFNAMLADKRNYTVGEISDLGRKARAMDNETKEGVYDHEEADAESKDDWGFNDDPGWDLHDIIENLESDVLRLDKQLDKILDILENAYQG